MRLAHDQLANQSAAHKIALLHGFTQTRRSMHGLISEMSALSTEFSAIAVDAPLHGESQHIATDVSGAADALVDQAHADRELASDISMPAVRKAPRNGR